jgi:hypothetical protein
MGFAFRRGIDYGKESDETQNERSEVSGFVFRKVVFRFLISIERAFYGTRSATCEEKCLHRGHAEYYKLTGQYK